MKRTGLHKKPSENWSHLVPPNTPPPAHTRCYSPRTLILAKVQNCNEGTCTLTHTHTHRGFQTMGEVWLGEQWCLSDTLEWFENWKKTKVLDVNNQYIYNGPTFGVWIGPTPFYVMFVKGIFEPKSKDERYYLQGAFRKCWLIAKDYQ